MKKQTLGIVLGMAAILPQLTMAQAYDYPAHKNVAINNYSETGFATGPAPHRFASKNELTVGSTIMVNDRYQRIYKKSGEKYNYYTSISRLNRIKVLSLNGDDSNPYIKVKVLSSEDTRLVGKTYFTRVPGLSEYEDYKYFDADVYMVQNIATEKLRVYQRICKDYSCPPKMIFETDFVSGHKTGDPTFRYNTHVGSYRIFEWSKFYQDRGTGGHYPSWYDPKFPAVPDKDASWKSWFSSSVMPWKSCHTVDGKEECSHKGMMRGAFGWYTALMEPNYGVGQWTHGTIGWAKSSQHMIKVAKGETFWGGFASIFTSLRSSGCSRVSNPSIAFLRHLLPVGTPLIKVYALEAYQDQASMEKNYNVGETSAWDFILTKDGVRKTGKKAVEAGKNYVEELGLDTGDNILEEGTYEFNIYPSVVQYQYKHRSRSRGGYKITRGCVEDTFDNYMKAGQTDDEDRKFYDIDNEDRIRSRQCNVYRIDAEKFKGRFYPDTGLIEGYKHPLSAPGVIRGGFRSEKWPKFFEAKRYKN